MCNNNNIMDVRNWKKILVQWITECDFMPCNFFNVEQSDIVSFYQNFCGLHQKACLEAAAAKHQSSISTFLKENYPDFDPHFDDEHSLSSTEYVYVYSLFLHFSCVKYPEKYFHDVCKKLSERCQQHIALFFKQLMNVSCISRETLRHAIAEATIGYSSPSSSTLTAVKSETPPSPKTNAGNSSSTLPSTPKRLNNSERVSPPTPKSYILQERTKEIFRLRALLDTERYEKSLLELQLKQNDERTLKLNNDHKKMQQRIQELKNDIFARNHESASTNAMNEDQFKRRFSKELQQKEQEINKLTDILSTLKEEKHVTQEQLNFAEKQTKLLANRVSELEARLEEQAMEIDAKEQTICCLTETKHELEFYIGEMRNKTRLERSSDVLDCSFTSRSGSSNEEQPENLGVAVVDVQLREKEYENAQLLEELSNLREGNARLAKEMVTLVDRHAKDFELILEKINDKNTELTGFDGFTRFIGFVEELAIAYKNEKQNVEQLQSNAEAAQQKNNALSRQLQDYDEEIGRLKTRLKESEQSIKEMEKHKLCLQTQLTTYSMDRESLKAEKTDFMANIKKLMNEQDEQQRKAQARETELMQNFNQLQEDKFKLQSKYDELEQINAQLSKKLETTNEQLRCKQTDYELELNNLKHLLTNHQLEAGTHQKAERVIKEKYEALFIQCEKLKKEARSADKHLEAMRQQLALKEMDISKLGPEIVNMRKMNNELVERIEHLMTQFKTEKEKHEKSIAKSEAKTREVTGEKEALEADLTKLRHEFDEMSKELEKTKSELTLVAIDVEALNSMLNEPMDVGSLGEVLGRIVERVDELLEQKLEANHKVEELQATLLKVRLEYEQLKKENTDLCQKYEENLQKLKIDLENAQAENEKLNEEISSLKEAHAKELQLLNAHHVEEMRCSQMRAMAEHSEAMQMLEDELKFEQEDKLQLQQQVKSKENALTEALADNKQQKLQFNDKLLQFEKQTHELLQQNEQLQKELHKTNEQHAQACEQLQLAETKLKEQLRAKEEQKCELQLSQRQLQMQVVDMQMSLEKCNLEKSNLQNELKTNKEAAAEQDRVSNERLKTFENSLRLLEDEKQKQAETNRDLQKSLQTAECEHQRMLEVKEGLQTQLARIQCEKNSLLEALEKTAEQLRRVKEMERTINTLKIERQTSADLIEELNDKNNKLQKQLEQKDNDFRTSMAEYQENLEDYRNKTCDLVRSLALESDKMEQLKTQIKQMLTVLENNKCGWLKSMLYETQVKNIFANDNTDAQLEEQHAELQSLQQFLSKLMLILQQLHKQVQDKDAVITDIKCNKNKLTLELKRYEENNENLEKVNEKLSAENASLLEAVEKQKKRCNGLISEKDLQLNEQKVLKELVNCMDVQEKTMRLIISQEDQENELLQKEVSEKENRQQQLEKQVKEMTMKLTQLQSELNALKMEKLQILQSAEEANKQLLQLKQETKTMQSNLTASEQQNTRLQQDLSETKHQLHEISSISTKAQSTLDTFNAEHQQLKQAHDLLKQEQQRAQEDLDRLANDLLSMQKQKNQVNDELKALQHVSKENAELSSQIAQLSEQNTLLQQQLEAQNASKTGATSKLQEIMQSSQTMESQLEHAEQQIQEMCAQVAANVEAAKKLQTENQRLNESVEAATKRTEKMAIKLGETQAQLQSALRETNKYKEQTQSLQREKDLLLADFHNTKERIFKAEQSELRQLEQINVLEHKNSELEQQLKKLLDTEMEAKEKVSKLEKIRDATDERVRAITTRFDQSEQECVHLTLEVGALTSQLKDAKQLVNEKLLELQQKQAQFMQLEAEANSLREQLQNSHAQCAQLTQSMTQLQQDVQQIRNEKTHIEEMHRQTSAQLEFAQKQKTDALKQKEQQIADLEKQVVKLMTELSAKTEQVSNLQQELRTLRTSASNDTASLNEELETLRARLTLADAAKEREQKDSAQLRLDNQILHAKYKDMKQRLADEMTAADERLKENRLELEGKLEKMKNKMKTLYNEEIIKLKTRQEREKLQMCSELERQRMQLAKYEEQVQKLSTKIVELNEEMLELKREKIKANTKLSHLEKELQKKSQFKYPSSRCSLQTTSQTSIMSSTTSGIATNKLSTNLAMEDEEGEVFNNTYLADLKSGRMPEYDTRRTIGCDEIAYRNSLLPPHLQSTYAAQYDPGLHSDNEDFKVSSHDEDAEPCVSMHVRQRNQFMLRPKYSQTHSLARSEINSIANSNSNLNLRSSFNSNANAAAQMSSNLHKAFEKFYEN